MEFDKSRVYSAANADELKIGSRVIVADNLEGLRNKVEVGGYVTKLLSIGPDNVEYRFGIDNGLGEDVFALAYLVEEAPKLKWTDLKIGDVIRDLKDNSVSMVTRIDSKDTDLHIYAGAVWFDEEDLKFCEKVQ